MRVKLKGVARVRKKLANGLFATYYYAWRGGPRLIGSPGSPEFQTSYAAAHAKKHKAPKDILRTVFDAFQDSADFTSLATRTRTDYKKHIRHIDTEFGDFPVQGLNDRRTRGEFLAWRDRLGAQSRRTADYRFAILARILAWALDRGLVPANPCQRPGRLYRSQRSEAVWTEADEAAFYAKAPTHLHLALTLALWTGQRQGDLVRLTWAAYDGEQIRLTQGKTQSRVSGRRAKRVVIPVGKPLKLALDAAKKSYEDAGKPLPPTILVTETGTGWTSDGFRTSWRKACTKAAITGVTFHDLRGTAVTRLAVAGCTVPEIATITGHSLKDVEEILDRHYLMRDSAMAKSAIRKLEKRGKLQTKQQTEAPGSSPSAAK